VRNVACVWDKACEVFAGMNALEKSVWLRKTRDVHLSENLRLDGRNHGDMVYDSLIMRLFVQYLVWRERTHRCYSRGR
jgi:hypothetical protein